MNKQEKEELANQLNSRQRNCPSDSWDKGYNEGLMNAVIVVRNMHTADEPLKVKVPEEFDEWYQQIKQRWGKSATDFALWKICQFGFGNGFEDVNNDRTSSTLSDWVCWNKEVAINAVWNGYEVEEEPKYRVLFPSVKKKHGSKFSYLMEDGMQCYSDFFESIPQLTEQEIKAIDERYWQFAVPVEKV